MSPSAMRVAAAALLGAALLLGLLGTSLILFKAQPVAHYFPARLPGVAAGSGGAPWLSPGDSGSSPGASPAAPGSSPSPGSSPDAGAGASSDQPSAAGPGATDQPGGQPTPANPPPPPPQFLEATQAGAYGWSTSGFENADGIQRSLPSQTTEYISRTGGQSISIHHVFSSQKESWLSLSQGPSAVVQTYSRSRVFFGPFGQDQAMNINPPITVLLLPPAAGQSWSGSFTGSGNVTGTYTGRTIDHSTLNIGGESVEVWGVRIDVQLQGDVQGSSSHQTWFSPKYGVGVRDVWTETVASGGHNYHCEGSMTSNSVHPS